MSELLVRPAELEDRESITAIYNHYVRETAVTFDLEPKTVAERARWFAQFAGPDGSGRAGPHRLLVAEGDGVVLGYAGTMPHRSKPAYDTSVETTIYLAPDATGQGLGRRLYDGLFRAIAAEDVHRVLAGITLPNDGSERLHESYGFERIGVFREVGRKFDRYWDVIWYEARLAELLTRDSMN